MKNTAIGTQAMSRNTTGSANTAVGTYALGAAEESDNNVAVGTYALTRTVSSGNVAVGQNALSRNTTGFGGTAVGHGVYQIMILVKWTLLLEIILLIVWIEVV